MALSHVALEGNHVSLVPLELGHVPALVRAAALGGGTFALTLVPADTQAMEHYVREALTLQTAGRALPYATVRKADGVIVGSTRFANLEYWDLAGSSQAEHPGPHAVEIGWTWLSLDAQRSALNTEAKWLMLVHAFETLRVERVMLKTDVRNARSRAAIERIGASFEGVLRRHMPASDGGVRDTAMYSIIAEEWPRVKAELAAKLAR
jgi:RimJ/RimL family protein N-acetyltransferase